MKSVSSLKLLSLSLLLAGLSFVAPLTAQAGTNISIAVVNPAELVQKAPQAEAARKRLKKKFSGRRQQLQDLRNKIQQQAQKLKKDSAAMSSDELESKQDDLQDKKRHFTQMQQNYNQDVQQSEHKEFGKLRESIQKVIVQVAKAKGYDLVLSNGIVYASNRVDITDDVLAKLKSNYGH